MTKNYFIILLLSLSFCVNAQTAKKTFSIGTAESIHSAILNEDRPLWIYAPSFDTTTFTRPAYPVLYLLDGDGNFASVMSMVQQLSAVNGNTVLPEMIIVGIRNTGRNRTRDLTPSWYPAGDSSSGGGEKFTSFIEKELVPYIDKNYATAPYRVFVGHSLGGLMVINALINHPHLFNAYVAIDPSMWWDHDALLKTTTGILQQADYKQKTLFLAIANTMSAGMDTSKVRKDTSEINHHIRSILKLSDNLKKSPSSHLRWNYKYYNEEDHGSVPLLATYDALHFIFDKNKFATNHFFDAQYKADAIKKEIVGHFNSLSEQMGYTVKPPEALINQFGYIFLQLKDFTKSHMFFQLNIDFFPDNFNPYDSMGDYYMAVNDKANAIASYSKSLLLKETADTRKKLEQLKTVN